MTAGVSIAVAQTCPLEGDVAANVDEHLRLARMAATAGAQLVLYPELSLTGYEMDAARSTAFSETDARLSPLSEAAASLSLTLIVGAPVRIGPQYFIAGLILGADGSIGLYTKHRLGAFAASAACDGTVPPAEATVFSPGQRNPLVRVGDATAAVAICADSGDPAHPRRAAERGAGIYLASMFVIPSEFDADSKRLQGYAVCHSMMVALANFGGPSGGLAAAGRSTIFAGTGEILVQLGERGAGVAIATRTNGGWHAGEVRHED